MPRLVALAVPFLSGVVAVVAAGCSKKPDAGGDPKGGPGGPAVVTVAHPLTEKVTLYTDLTGTVDQKDIVDIRPRVSGYIKEVKFSEGKEVQKDQVLFVIDPVIYEAQLRQSEGSVRNYEAQLAKANADLARTRETFERGATARTELDQAVASKGIAEAQLFTAKASVAEAQQNLQWTEVKSPIAGLAGRAYLTPGNLATKDQSLLTTVVAVDPMYAYFDVDEATVRMYRRLLAEKKIKSVAEGARVAAEIALRDETGYPHKGFLEFVDNRLNPSTGSLTIRGEFPNPKAAGTDTRPLAAGFYCKGRIPVGAPYDAVLIPPSAVATDQGRKVVYVIGAENRVEARPVELGPISRQMQIVQKGLSTADRVVIRGMGRVLPGVVVDPHEEKLPTPPPATDGPGDAGQLESAEPSKGGTEKAPSPKAKS